MEINKEFEDKLELFVFCFKKFEEEVLVNISVMVYVNIVFCVKQLKIIVRGNVNGELNKEMGRQKNVES